MHKLTHLSHSSLEQFKSRPERFYLRKLAATPVDHEPQTAAQAAGLVFDYGVKVHVASRHGLAPPVLPVVKRSRWRTFADAFARRWWPVYRPAFDDLMRHADYRIDEEKTVTFPNGVTLKGILDLRYRRAAIPVIHDWKVKGADSALGASPTPGYQRCGDKQHKNYIPWRYHGVEINKTPLEVCSPVYAAQLTTYAWLCGHSIRDPWIASVHEVIVRPSGVRVARHLGRVSESFQLALWREYTRAWRACQTGHVFDWLSPADNAARCAALDRYAASLAA